MIKKIVNKQQIQENLLEALQQLMQFMPGGVFCYDVDEDQEFLFISESMPGMFGYTMEEFKTKFNNRFPEMVCEEDRERIMREIDSQLQNGNNDYCMYRVETADGTSKWIYDRGRLITDENGKRWFYVVIVDANELKAAEQRRLEHEQQLLIELRNRTEHDFLTGFLNRYAAIVSIEKAIQKYSGGTLFLLEIDNFSVINEKKGYDFGDQVLKDISVSMRQMVHPEEILGRFGEDKFIIFAPGNYNKKAAEKRAEKIGEMTREIMDFDVEDGGCSIGITITNRSDITFEEMFRVADKALHEVKEAGKYCIEIL